MTGRALAIVRCSIKFNDQSFCCAVEVDDIGPNTLLAAEFSAMEG